MHDAFDYLLDLSMSIPGSGTDRHALREAHTTLVSMNADCRAISPVSTPTSRQPGVTSHAAIAA